MWKALLITSANFPLCLNKSVISTFSKDGHDEVEQPGEQSRQTFAVKAQVVSILGFADHTVWYNYTTLLLYIAKAAIDNT